MGLNQPTHDRSGNSSRTNGGLNLPSHDRKGGGSFTTRSVSSSCTMSSQLPPSSGGLSLPPPSFLGTAGTRSVASASNASSIPPPPGRTTLQRAGYLQTTPGAQQYPGTIEPDDGTIIIGDGQSSFTGESMPGLISARPIHTSSTSFESSTAPVHRISERDYEVTSAPVQRVNAQHLLEKTTVKAEPIREEDEPRPFWKNWKAMCGIVFLFVLAIVLGVALAIGLSNTSDDSSSPATTTDPNPPTQVAISSAPPSSSPTLPFDPPNAVTCLKVSEGLDVNNQESMIVKRFSLDLDVIVVDQVQTIAPFLEEIRSDLLQKEIAPEIAQCYDIRRKLQRSRSLVDRFVVGNAIFESAVLSTTTCASVTTENCFSILSTLAIYLKDEESDSAMIAHILDIFAESWEVFTIPFKSIQLTGARIYTTTGDVSSPSAAPSFLDGEDDEEDEDEN